MENLKQFKTRDLEGAAFNLRHAKVHRQGGLLAGEQVALDKIDAELTRRATGGKQEKLVLNAMPIRPMYTPDPRD